MQPDKRLVSTRIPIKTETLRYVPQIFGPTLLMPGQSLRLPFAVASSYTFACTAHLSGQMTVVVDPWPTSPWARIRWRVHELLTAKT